MNATINDILLTATGHCLQQVNSDYMATAPAYFRPRFNMIMNMRNLRERPKELADKMRQGTTDNSLGLVITAINMDRDASFSERLKWNQQELRRHMMGYSYLVMDNLVRYLARLSGFGIYCATRVLSSKYTGFFTNLKGPTKALEFEGYKVSSMYYQVLPFVVGIGVSILSYNGTLRVVVCSDEATVVEPYEVVSKLTTFLKQRPEDVDSPQSVHNRSDLI